jgi:hypothetical protein
MHRRQSEKGFQRNKLSIYQDLIRLVLLLQWQWPPPGRRWTVRAALSPTTMRTPLSAALL